MNRRKFLGMLGLGAAVGLTVKPANPYPRAPAGLVHLLGHNGYTGMPYYVCNIGGHYSGLTTTDYPTLNDVRARIHATLPSRT